MQLRNSGYNPWDYYSEDAELHKVMNQIKNGFFSSNQPNLFKGIFDSLVNEGDHYLHMADYRSYIDCQDKAANLFKTSIDWHKMAILNVARIGKFSSDRVIKEYANEIWKVEPCHIE